MNLENKNTIKYINTYDINEWISYQDLLNDSLPHNSFQKPRELPSNSLDYSSSLFDLIEGKVIVECGTGMQGEMSGDSMLYWFNKTNAEKIHCIDLTKKWIESVKNEIGNHDRVKYYHQDCFNVVPVIKNIDLLYMDFWLGDGNARANAYLELYNISNHPKMILIDDTDHTSPWKQTLITPAAVNDGYKIIYIGRQTLLLRHDIAEKYAKDIEYFNYEFGN